MSLSLYYSYCQASTLSNLSSGGDTAPHHLISCDLLFSHNICTFWISLRMPSHRASGYSLHNSNPVLFCIKNCMIASIFLQNIPPLYVVLSLATSLDDHHTLIAFNNEDFRDCTAWQMPNTRSHFHCENASSREHSIEIERKNCRLVDNEGDQLLCPGVLQ